MVQNSGGFPWTTLSLAGIKTSTGSLCVYITYGKWMSLSDMRMSKETCCPSIMMTTFAKLWPPHKLYCGSSFSFKVYGKGKEAIYKYSISNFLYKQFLLHTCWCTLSIQLKYYSIMYVCTKRHYFSNTWHGYKF